MKPHKIFNYYYLSIPIFVLMESVFSSQIRVVLPEDYQNAYFLYCAISFVLGGLVFTKPLSSAVFSILESALCLYLLMASVMIPVMGLAAGTTFNFGVNNVVNFLLAGGILIFGLRSLISGLGNAREES